MNMKEGMLWFDDSPGRTLEEKVAAAAGYYAKKYGGGKWPELCFVHPSAFFEEGKKKAQVGETSVAVGRAVLIHHFWLGNEERRA